MVLSYSVTATRTSHKQAALSQKDDLEMLPGLMHLGWVLIRSSGTLSPELFNAVSGVRARREATLPPNPFKKYVLGNFLKIGKIAGGPHGLPVYLPILPCGSLFSLV